MATKVKTPANSKAKAKPADALPLMFTIPPATKGLLSKAQIAALLSISESTLKEMILSREYPVPDTHFGIMPRWSVDTHNLWVSERCSKPGKA